MSRALAAVAFLSSYDVQFITGGPIVVDGGQPRIGRGRTVSGESDDHPLGGFFHKAGEAQEYRKVRHAAFSIR